MQEIIIIAGPNGAGKTSFANEYLSSFRGRFVFLNADEVAREIASANLPLTQLDWRAGREMLTRINDCVDAGLNVRSKRPCASAEGLHRADTACRRTPFGSASRRASTTSIGCTGHWSTSGTYGTAWRAGFSPPRNGMTDGQDHRRCQSSGGLRQGGPQCRRRSSRCEGGPVRRRRRERQPAPQQAETEKVAFSDRIRRRGEGQHEGTLTLSPPEIEVAVAEMLAANVDSMNAGSLE
jgi:hypothetical protein